MNRWLLLAFGLLAAQASAQTCGDALGAGAQRIDSAQFQLAYKLLPDPVPVGRHFAIDVVLCPKGNAALPAELRVDATMPEHKHGMNYRPSVKTLGTGPVPRRRADVPHARALGAGVRAARHAAPHRCG